MADVRCPGCDEAIEIEPGWYGRKVACPSCGERFVARRPGEEDEEEPRPRKKKVVVDDDEEDEEEDDRPRKKRRKRDERPMPMGRGTKQLILAAAILGPILLLCLGCGGWVGFTLFAPASYPDPWVTQALPDGSYSAQFPRSPRSESLGEFGFAGPGVKYLLEEDLPKDGAFAFGHMDDLPLSFDEAFQEEVDNIRRETGAKASTPKAITSAGCPGKEVEFSAGGGKVVYRMLDASHGGRRRYLLMLAGGRSVSEADRNKFLDSLTRGR